MARRHPADLVREIENGEHPLGHDEDRSGSVRS